MILLVGINDLALSLSEEERENGRAYDTAQRSFLFKSRVYQLWYIFQQIVFKGAVTVRGSGHGSYEPVPIDPRIHTALPDDLSTILPQLPEYRENINQLIDIAQQSDIQVLFLTQPMLFGPTPYWDSMSGTAYWIENNNLTLSAADWWRLLEIYNQTLLEICEERGVACYDLASQIPHDEQYFYDIVHFNEAGSTLVAEYVTQAAFEHLWKAQRE